MKINKKERDVLVRLLRTAASDAVKFARELYERTGYQDGLGGRALEHEKFLLDLAARIDAEGRRE